jgi:peroxiredoxin Q/BCP
MLQPGDKAPDFELTDAHGSTFKLSSVLGQKSIVLFFYPKDDSFGCTKQACAFRDSYQAFTDAGAIVIGISSDSANSHEAFAKKHHLPYTLLSDPKRIVRERYKVPKTLGLLPGRTTYVINRQGIIAHGFNAQLQFEAHIDQALTVVKTLNTP